MEILDQLKSGLARSNAEERKEWALQIAEGDVDVELLLVLLHTDEKTAQRFTWLITDIAELDSELVIPCMPLLFSLRDQMPFPGMDRSVAKWLLLTNVPEVLEREAIAQLFEWMEDSRTSISCKSFSAKVLYELAHQDRINVKRFERVLNDQLGQGTKAYSVRIRKMLDRLDDLLSS